LASWIGTARIDVLKLIAILAMVVDHVNTIWFATGYPALRVVFSTRRTFRDQGAHARVNCATS
jgi:hypothetical protein